MILVILLIVVGAISVFFYYSSKFNSPFIQIFILGKKGSGKSTLLVRYMMEYHKKGYSIYTTMRECTLPYVSYIDIEELGDYVGKPKSLIALDEVGIAFDARKFKTFKDSWRDYFKYQRHYKNVVVMASQSWDVDLKLRSLCDKLFICGKIGAISYAREVTRKITLTEPTGDSESRIADQLMFKPMGIKLTWIPKYAKWFASFNPPPRPYFVDPPEVPQLTRKERRLKRKNERAHSRKRTLCKPALWPSRMRFKQRE